MYPVAMAEAAYIDPDEAGRFHLNVAGEPRTYQVEVDDQGRHFLCEILPLPPELEALFAEQDRHPERMVRRSVRG